MKKCIIFGQKMGKFRNNFNFFDKKGTFRKTLLFLSRKTQLFGGVSGKSEALERPQILYRIPRDLPIQSRGMEKTGDLVHCSSNHLLDSKLPTL